MCAPLYHITPSHEAHFACRKFAALSNNSIEILTNPEIIAVSQDTQIGAPLAPFFWGKNPDGTWDPYVGIPRPLSPPVR